MGGRVMAEGPPYRLEITLSEEQWDRLNAARGHEPRASFVKRALEAALAESAVRRQSGGADVVEHGSSSHDSGMVSKPRQRPTITETWAR
jgi:hypothetical protein